MEGKLERLDAQLVNIQVQLRRLEYFVKEMPAGAHSAADQALIESIRRRRDDLLACSRKVAERLDTMCRADP